MISFTVNGVRREVKAEPRTTLLETLREELDLKGTKFGCGEGECGACTVVVDGESVCSCLVLTGSVDGADIKTVEGVADDPLGATIVENFALEGAVQCGFCTPGFIVQGWSAIASGNVSDAQSICDVLGGNLCRCTGYSKIIRAMEKSLPDTTEVTEVIRRKPTLASPPAKASLVVDGYWRPETLAELCDGLAGLQSPYHFVAGGTDILVKGLNHLKQKHFVDLNGLQELRFIDVSEGCLRIGARASWSEIAESTLVVEHAPLLAQAAPQVGAGQIQNRGTLAGNIANASPAADGLPPLYAYDAEVVCLSAQGERRVAIDQFVLGPGKIDLRPGEVITHVVLPCAENRQNEAFFFEKRGPRLAQTISKASLAYHAWVDSAGRKQVRIALGAVAATVLRAHEAERLLAEGGNPEQAAQLISQQAKPITDLRSTADYRRALVGRLLLRGLADAALYRPK